jgi:hypothetical protein
VPPRSTARPALAHGLKLGGDAGDQSDQPVIALLAWCPVPQCRLDDALRHQPPHGRQPRVQLGQDALQVCGVTAGADLADGVRVTGAQAEGRYRRRPDPPRNVLRWHTAGASGHVWLPQRRHITPNGVHFANRTMSAFVPRAIIAKTLAIIRAIACSRAQPTPPARNPI